MLLKGTLKLKDNLDLKKYNKEKKPIIAALNSEFEGKTKHHWKVSTKSTRKM